jgi:hypothetical protein
MEWVQCVGEMEGTLGTSATQTGSGHLEMELSIEKTKG